MAQRIQYLPAMQETWVQSLGWEDPVEKEMGNTLQYSCLENPTDRGAWRATIHGVTESDTTEQLHFHFSLPCWLWGKESACQCKRHRFNPWLGRSPGGGNGNPLQYSYLRNPMDRGAWWTTVHGLIKNWTGLSDWAQAQAQTIVKSLSPQFHCLPVPTSTSTVDVTSNPKVGFEILVRRCFRNSKTFVLQLRLQPTGLHLLHLSPVIRGPTKAFRSVIWWGKLMNLVDRAIWRSSLTVTCGRLKNKPGEDLERVNYQMSN